MHAAAPIFVIIGQLSAGKSTVARSLLESFAHGYHVDVDGMREMVSSGLASPLEWTQETDRQFTLALRASAAAARIYSDAGFAVAIEGSVDPSGVESALAEVGLRDRMIGIVLHPRLEVALERNRTRATKPFDTSMLDGVMRDIDADLARAATREGWHEIDNSDEPVGATVARIRACSAGG